VSAAAALALIAQSTDALLAHLPPGHAPVALVSVPVGEQESGETFLRFTDERGTPAAVATFAPMTHPMMLSLYAALFLILIQRWSDLDREAARRVTLPSQDGGRSW